MGGVRCGTCQNPMDGGVCPKCSVLTSVPNQVISAGETPPPLGFRCGVCGETWTGFQQTCPHRNGVEQKGGSDVNKSK